MNGNIQEVTNLLLAIQTVLVLVTRVHDCRDGYYSCLSNDSSDYD